MWKWLYYYLIIILILGAIIAWIIIAGRNDPTQDKTLNHKQLNTGDLLFVKYTNSLGHFMKFWSGSPWTHVAMVYVDSNRKVYVMETANYRHHKGVLFLPYEKWLKLNKNCVIGVKQLIAPVEFDRNILLTEFEKLTMKKLDTFNISWVRLLTKKPYKSLDEQQNITCYELVVNLLQESGIAKKEFSPSSFFPKNLIDNDLELNSGFYFDLLYSLKN